MAQPGHVASIVLESNGTISFTYMSSFEFICNIKDNHFLLIILLFTLNSLILICFTRNDVLFQKGRGARF